MAIRSFFTTLRGINRPSLVLLEEKSIRSFSSGTSSIVIDTLDESPQSQDKDLKSRIFKLRFPKRSATTVIQNWVSEGNKVTLSELRQLAKDLRRSQRYKHALEISEWIVTHQEFELSDSDYAVRIDLMTKVFGVDAAERYFQGLPVTAKTGETYTALLHSYASAKMTERAEGLFERIKESNVSMNALFYNEMMTLYMSVGELGKVSLVIEELKRQKITPDLFTYNLWISACAATMDIENVRRVLDEMREDCNSNEGWVTYRKLVDIYITSANLVSSEDNVLVETEKKITQREWITYDFLIILYTGLGNKERIDAIWKSLKLASQKMTSRNFICIISSYMMLGHLKEAEEVLNEWKQSTSTEFDAHKCKRVLDAFAGAGLTETTESLRTLMQKRCNLIDGSQ